MSIDIVFCNMLFSYYSITILEGCSMNAIGIESPKKKASLGARIKAFRELLYKRNRVG